MNCTTNKRRPRTQMNGFMNPSLSSIFNELLQSPINEVVEKAKTTTRPSVNISKTSSDYTLALALPGIKKENISIKIENKKLNIRSTADDTTDTKYRLREYNYDNISRDFSLPKNIATDKISADYTDGILRLTLPIAPEAQPKSIKVS